MRMLYRDMARRLTYILPARRIAIVGIDGPSGSGKTTFGVHLHEALRELGTAVETIKMEDFYITQKSKLKDDQSAIDFIRYYDWRRLRDQVLLPLTGGKDASFRQFDWRSGQLGAWRDLKPAGVLIVDGLSSTRPELKEYLTMRTWVDCPRETRLERGLARAGDSPMAHWEHDILMEEDRYIRFHHPDEAAHLLLDGSGTFPHDIASEFVVIARRDFALWR
jgi:uridine kinase